MTLNEAIEHLNDILQPNKKWECEECRNEHIQLRDWLNELKSYKDLEEQKKLLKLPCAVGDVIWNNDWGWPCSFEVTGFSFGNLNDGFDEEKVLEEVLVYFTNSSGSITGNFAVSEIGKTVFLTREAAEVALKRNE